MSTVYKQAIFAQVAKAKLIYVKNKETYKIIAEIILYLSNIRKIKE